MSIQNLNLITIQVGSPIKTNTYVLHPSNGKQAIVIDPGADSHIIASQIRGLEVTHILLTHGHFDHYLACRSLRAVTGAKICMHALDAHMLKKDLGIDPDVRFVQGFNLQVGRARLSMLYTPGHSAGSVCYYIERNGMLFSGDTLLSDPLGPGCTFFPSGSVNAMAQSLERLKALPDHVKAYPGHGDPFLLSLMKNWQAE
jgi:glyoxylase-like metal-dependent hydrolase (beta-lactamase superfamily II)